MAASVSIDMTNCSA